MNDAETPPAHDAPRKAGLRLASIAGIEVRAQWSLLVIVGLLAASLALGLIPEAVDPVSDVAAWVGGFLGALLFVLSLLVHELSHSLVAARHGVTVRTITLWLLGGMALMERDAPNARAALRIAIAGPLASFGCALVAAAVAAACSVVEDPAQPVAVGAAVFGWLALINVALGAFNLLPGSPLDGGRVLRAWFWRRSGDRLGSQVRAARAGRTLARLLVAFGLVEFAFGGGVGGLWIAFIGWFVHSAAAAEELDAELRTMLGGVRLGELMTRDPTTVAPDLSVAQLIEELLLRHRSAYPVVSEGSLVGLVTLADVRRVPTERRATTHVSDIMTPRSQCTIAAPQDEAVETFGRVVGANRILVVDGERLVGILTPTDMARIAQTAHMLGER